MRFKKEEASCGMSAEENLKRFFVLFFLLFGIIFVLLTMELNAQEILPFNQIKPGDRGYGLTVFQGQEPERFNFVVLGTENFGITKYIVVSLYGGPTDENGTEIIRDGNIYGGMSGSPLYIDGKIIGALATSGQFFKKAQARVTPIELMINFKTTAFYSLNRFLDNLPDTGLGGNGFAMPQGAHQLKAGDSYMICEVWDNDSDFCLGPAGTVTLIDPKNPKIFYSLGHSGLAQNGITKVPFWKAEAITTIPSFSISQKLLKKTGPMLGTVIFNGPFGQIARFGAVSPSVTLTVQIKNNFRSTLAREHLFAYTPNMSVNISRALSGMRRLIDNVFGADVEVRINISGLPQIYFHGAEEFAGVSAVINVFSRGGTIPNVENMTVTLNARPPYEVLELKKATMESLAEKDNNLELKLSLLAGNGEFFTNTLNIIVDKKYLGKKLSIASGGEIASRILSNLGPSENAVNLLNKVAFRDALYLYFIDGENTPKPSEPAAIVISIGGSASNSLGVSLSQKELSTSEKEDKKSEQAPSKENDGNLTNGWKNQPPETPIIEILSKINLPNENYLITGSRDVVLTLTPSDAKSQSPGQKKKKKFWLF